MLWLILHSSYRPGSGEKEIRLFVSMRHDISDSDRQKIVEWFSQYGPTSEPWFEPERNYGKLTLRTSRETVLFTGAEPDRDGHSSVCVTMDDGSVFLVSP